MSFFQCGSVRIMVGQGERSPNASGAIVYFRVADLTKTAETLVSRGVRFAQEPHLVARMKSHDLWMAFITDPGGQPHRPDERGRASAKRRREMKPERWVLFLLLLSGLSLRMNAQSRPTAPETVLATFRVKSDQIGAFLKLMPDYWAALRAQHLVLEAPHVVLQGDEHGRPLVSEVFSWRDHDVPEHVPPVIQQYWDRINAMVESRDGHAGIDFPEMKMIVSH